MKEPVRCGRCGAWTFRHTPALCARCDTERAAYLRAKAARRARERKKRGITSW